MHVLRSSSTASTSIWHLPSLPRTGSPLMEVPHSLRQAAVSTWLCTTSDPAQVAEWAGHSVAVLLKLYAKRVYTAPRQTRSSGSGKPPAVSLRGSTLGKNVGKTSRRTAMQLGCGRIPRAEGQISSPLVRKRLSFCGRCWVRTNVGDADGFTDRSLWPLGQPAGAR